MGIVTLVSGGLDSTLMAKLIQETDVRQYPLFIDYGQRAKEREYTACVKAMNALGLPEPKTAGLGGFGTLIRSGLTDADKHVAEDAFTPGRNLLFLLVGAAWAYQNDAETVAIGLLNEDTSLFPDQTAIFLSRAQDMISFAMGRNIRILAPLSDFHKADVVNLARTKDIEGTYSCHAGGATPCGACIACQEFPEKEV
ncbi:7-cyano-7-deazaguanine synthase [Magnetococcus sp. PR-3]|uniref:7-cyano-7-deazaguanine synthase n=1 Tax=Magnetococcus sp. PR-3 TaxID=3120355 RepID=UPI002FCE17F9